VNPNDPRRKSFEKAAEPLIKWLNENGTTK